MLKHSNLAYDIEVCFSDWTKKCSISRPNQHENCFSSSLPPYSGQKRHWRYIPWIFLCLVCVLAKGRVGLLSEENLLYMKPSLLNCSRGWLWHHPQTLFFGCWPKQTITGSLANAGNARPMGLKISRTIEIDFTLEGGEGDVKWGQLTWNLPHSAVPQPSCAYLEIFKLMGGGQGEEGSLAL